MTCAVCGKPLAGRADARTCSPRCRQRARRAAKAALKRAAALSYGAPAVTDPPLGVTSTLVTPSTTWAAFSDDDDLDPDPLWRPIP
jgi:hypothetical protein